MDSLARRERTALCDLMAQVGPEAPTLCAGWTVRDLAAHLVVRESSPAAAGIVARPLAGWTRRSQESAASRPWPDLLAAVRNGGPRWSPVRVGVVDRSVNTFEFVVHHEDVRRAQPEWRPRELPDSDQHELWRRLGGLATWYARRCPVGLTVQTPDGRSLVANRTTPGVTVTGQPLELVLLVHGRGAQAEITVDGPAEALARFDRSRFTV